MKTYPTEDIRNVVLLGHSGAGKTTVAEALMARAGALQRVGRVDDGTSVLDTEPEEVARHLSISLALAPFEWTTPGGRAFKVNLIDCPGYPDFVGEVHAALSIADLAVFVLSAVEGVEVQTELLWREARARGLARLVFVNKDDKERADFHAVLDQLRAVFGNGFAPLQLPLGEAGALHGVADVLSEDAFDYEPGGAHHLAAMPDDVAGEEHRLHEEVVEEIVAGDDDQLERYLSGDEPSVAELACTLAHQMAAGTEFPVLVGSAASGVGIDRLADFICELVPSPADLPTPVVAGTETIAVPAAPMGEPLVHVFKTIADPFVGQLSVFKVLSGTIRSDDRLVNARTGVEERLHGLFVLRGKEQTAVGVAVAGDIAAVAKLAGTRTGDTLAPKGMPVRVREHATVVPNYGVAIVPVTQSDDDRLNGALHRLQAEDPVLCVDRVEETGQTVLRGVGDAHIAVTLERLARKFSVRVDTADVRVPYRETIVGHGAAEGKVKKQSGGHGQFAIANLRVAPLPRGAGFEFSDAIVGGAIPRNYVPAVQKGVEDTMISGGVHGFPVVDVRVECYDGKFHSVDSSEMAFKTAASLGLKQALADAGPAVLEPISMVRVTVPSGFQGDVMADVTSRRGRVHGTDVAEHGEQEIIAFVPTSELARYAVELRSMTAGRGRFTAQHDHYDVLPTHLVDKVKKSLLKS
ncbi:MAG: small GTP-binding protein [Ilumatobacteraceae bacterium]|nr:small GTP-binding protein [Ilumatobacteraceae bacterium]